jgi:hypothetical protein
MSPPIAIVEGDMSRDAVQVAVLNDCRCGSVSMVGDNEVAEFLPIILNGMFSLPS